MKDKDLLNVAFIFIFIILSAWIIGLRIELNKSNNEKFEIMKIALQNHRLNEEYINTLQESREQLNKELDVQSQEIEEYKHLSRLKKDLARH